MPKPNKFASPYGKPDAPVIDCAARRKPVVKSEVMYDMNGMLMWFDELWQEAQPTIPKILAALAHRAERVRAAESARDQRRARQRVMERHYGAAAW